MAATYKVNELIARKQDNIYALVDGKLVGLLKEGVKALDGGKDGPEKTVKVPLATQADLKWLFEQGTQDIVVKEETAPAKAEQKA